jgi:two-component system, sensor histidine kinase PdtaS
VISRYCCCPRQHKHAFPGGRAGKITIDYQSSGSDWTLAVNDDGVGMQSKTAGSTPGLGTSIIEALAKQLHARVQVADARPGTVVSIMRPALAEPVTQAI